MSVDNIHRKERLTGTFQHESGYCWRIELSGYSRHPEHSMPIVLEDDRALLKGSAFHDDIRNLGNGRCSFWNGWLYFSTSDNTNPNSNGRTYYIGEVVEQDQMKAAATGVYANIFNALKFSPLSLPGKAAVLFSEEKLDFSSLPHLIHGFSHLKVMLPEQEPAPGDCITCSTFVPNSRPLILNPNAREELRGRTNAAVFLWSFERTGGSTLWDLSTLGIRAFYFWNDGWQTLRMNAAVVRKFSERVSRLLMKKSSSGGKAVKETNTGPFGSFAAALKIKPRHKSHTKKSLKIVQYVGGLSPGGAERQLCYLATELKRKGHDSRVYTTHSMENDAAHYAGLLSSAKVVLKHTGQTFNADFWEGFHRCPVSPRLVHSIPDYIRGPSLNLLGELLADPPDVLHSWMDHSNIYAGLPALLAHVPLIVLSTRNVNPSHFPYLYYPWMRDWYLFLAQSPRVHFINNSHNGARDYAEWLGVPRKRFHVVLNGVDFSRVSRPSHGEIAAFRKSLGLTAGDPVVAGIFRLSAEKRPHVFLEIIREAAKKIPGLHAIHVGIGPMETETRAAIDAAGLCGRVHMVGRRSDVNVIMAASDAMLLVSDNEGTPNVLLEAQWLGCPPVATRVGGVTDAVSDGKTGILHDAGDVSGIINSLVRLLNDRDLHNKIKTAGPAFVQEKFSLDRMVNETIEVYRKGLP